MGFLVFSTVGNNWRLEPGKACLAIVHERFDKCCAENVADESKREHKQQTGCAHNGLRQGKSPFALVLGTKVSGDVLIRQAGLKER